ncbi:MAG TPA: ATP-binding protein, partial [Thermodesulfobacteriota bacterium]|nr:ATP-binding protein [Thermodesulfobacteriota bacterium]
SRWTLMLDSESKPKSVLAVDTDITEKKRFEAQFLRAQRMESIGVLAGGIAHDLNNILSPIMMALEILRNKFEDEQSQKLFNTLEASAQRGADLVKQVLSFARGLDSERTVIQIRHLISEIQKILRETFPRSIEVITDVPSNLWLISADPTQLQQVLMNLCINARDAMPEGGKLSISAENLFIDENHAKIHIDARAGHYIVITILDTGVGIPPEIRDKTFDPFFTTKEFGKGTGLGLSTSYGIVKSHGGFIHVYSEVDKGSQFKIYLPAIETSDTRGVKVGQIEKLPLGNGELILVVDDEASIRETAKATLKTYGYRVITASDGAEAVALYTHNKEDIKLVIIDMMMPIMDGPTTIRTLRDINPQIRIIAVSGLAEKDKLIEVGKAEVQHAFIPKPYTAEVLLKTVQSFLT